MHGVHSTLGRHFSSYKEFQYVVESAGFQIEANKRLL